MTARDDEEGLGPGDDVPVGMTDRDIVNFVVSRQADCEAMARPLYEQWDLNWGLYHNDVEFTEKQDWQSQQVLSEVFPITERACGLLKRALMGPGNWFSLEMADESLEAAVQDWFERYLELAGFAPAFRDCVKNAILSSLMVMKMFQGGPNHPLRVRVVSPYDFWPDPTGLDRFVIERMLVRRSDLQAWAAASEGTGRPPLYRNLEELDRASLRYSESDTRWTQRTQLAMMGESLRRGVVELLEYWGDLEDERSNVVARNIVCTVANRAVLVRPPQVNPFRHGQRPYAYASIVALPDTPYGKSLIESVAPTVLTMTEILNLVLDSYTLAALPIAEADTGPGGLDPAQLDEGLRPGTILERRVAGPNPALRPVKAGVVDMAAVPILQFLDRIKQRNTSVTDPVQGIMVSKRGTTATEVATTTQSALGLFDNYASDIEAQFLEPALRLALATLMEVPGLLPDAEMRRRLKDRPDLLQALDEMLPEAKVQMLRSGADIRVHGISSMVQKLQTLQRLQQLLAMAAANPEIAMRLRIRQTLERFLDAMELDSSDLLASEEEVQLRQRYLAQLQMGQMAQASAGPVGPAGPAAGVGLRRTPGTIVTAPRIPTQAQPELEGEAPPEPEEPTGEGFTSWEY